MTEPGRRCRDAAREDGPAAALRLLASAVCPDALPCGPAGHAVVPADLERSCERAWVNGAVRDRRREEEESLATIALAGGDLVALRCSYGAPPEWVTGVAWLRLGLSERLLAHCTRYLRERTSGDGPLLQYQMVRGVIADALTDQLEAGAMLDTGCGPVGARELGTSADGLAVGAGRERVTLADGLEVGAGCPCAFAHERITLADRALLRLLGASGFLDEGQAQEAYVSELLADAYAGSGHG